jgi:hypothetical protein
MTELCISTAGRDLALIVRLLASLRLTGRLEVVQGHWAGSMCFDQGRLVAAAFQTEQGLLALEALLIALPDGRCTFYSGAPANVANLQLGRRELEAEVQQLAQRQARLERVVPSLAMVPRASDAPDTPSLLDEVIALPRSALATLAAIDGRRNINAICGKRGLVRTLEDLATLENRGLIRVVSRNSPAALLVALQAWLVLAHRALRHKAHALRRAERWLRRAGGERTVRAGTPASTTLLPPSQAVPDDQAHVSAQDREHRGTVSRTVETPPGPSNRLGAEDEHEGRAVWRRAVLCALGLMMVGLGVMLFVPLTSTFPGSPTSGSGPTPPAPGHAAAPTPAGLAATPPTTPRSLEAPPRETEDSPPRSAGSSTLRSVFEERFGSTVTNWPNDPQSIAWITEEGTYRVARRQPSRFVAIGAPWSERVQDVVVTATFRKSGGPPGGKYGLIVRDQGPGPRDGLNQAGNFYALVVNDRAEFTIARREDVDWVELVPWTPSDAVRPGNTPNELVALAIGSHIGLAVNGTLVFSVTDDALDRGAVGIYVNGSGTEVEVESFLVEVPS